MENVKLPSINLILQHVFFINKFYSKQLKFSGCICRNWLWDGEVYSDDGSQGYLSLSRPTESERGLRFLTQKLFNWLMIDK